MSEEILDLNELLERVQDDKELLVELLDIFVEDFQEKDKQLAAAIEQKNYDQIKSIAHSLKGASGNISAKALREVCIKIEEMGKANDLTGAADVVADMGKEFEALSSRISEVKNEFQG